MNFKKILTDHLELEDTEFYPKFFEKIKKIGGKIDEYDDVREAIEIVMPTVISFWEKYNSVESLQKESIHKLREDYVRMTSRLEIRINAEEQYLYSKWIQILGR